MGDFLVGDLNLWRRKMRHMSKRGLKRIPKCGLVDGFDLSGNTISGYGFGNGIRARDELDQVPTSTCEAEVNVAVAAAKDAAHLKRHLIDLTLAGDCPLRMKDNSACIAQAQSGLKYVHNGKHFEVKQLFFHQETDLVAAFC